MPKLTSEKLRRMQEESGNKLNLKNGGSGGSIIIHMGTCGIAAGARTIETTFLEEFEKNEIKDITLRSSGCAGFCSKEPMVTVELPGDPPVKYGNLNPDKAKKIVNEHIFGGKTVEKFTIGIGSEKDIPFFKKQKLIVLRNKGIIDPGKIEDYIERAGYAALNKVLTTKKPEEVIKEIIGSGLRGRGGGGFPTGIKWKICREEQKTPKYIIGNCDEGDPGAYMDRSLLESDPHTVIEGMTIAAYAIGALKGYMYIRTEYPLAVKQMEIAIFQAKDHGLLGENILDTGFDFNIEIREGAGAFVCGEETSLIHSIEGKSPEPRQRPPFPAQVGIWGCPTVINNVETLANVPLILNRSAVWYSKIGNDSSKGTKIFSLVGKINNSGLIEVPMGITLKEIIYDIGGGIPGNKKFKAVQTGGPSGGCIPIEHIDLPIDYESLKEVGSIMGSGGMIVMDEDTCMVDVSKFFVQFTNEESCGKCNTCRDGSGALLEVLTRITEGKGQNGDIEFLEELSLAIKDTSMCGLGSTLPNPVLSTMRYFQNEYLEHINNKECTAGVCRELVGASCQSGCPIGTETWRYIAYIARGEYESAYQVIREVNPFPSVCARVCDHPCEDRCRAGTTGGQAIAIRTLKRFITDRIDPSVYKPPTYEKTAGVSQKIAVVGSGPAGLSTAHYLSLKGYKVTIFERAGQAGGMLNLCIPIYRIPKDVLHKEIEALLNDNIELKFNIALGSDISIDSLFKDGYNAIFLGMGAHKSRLLNIEGEDLEGVYPALDFLKAFNIHKKNLAFGHVGIIGGGDSAVDAARIAIRQKTVKSVTIFYRRTREEMPDFEDEVDAALQEGIQLKELISPVSFHSQKNRLKSVEFITNKQGEVDADGRRSPVPVPGTEQIITLDTLIITIGDIPDIDYIPSMGINLNKRGTLMINKDTMTTNRPGVFAGGDVVTGASTVVEAIAAGKKAALMINKYLCGEELKKPVKIRLPEIYIEPTQGDEKENAYNRRVESPTIPIEIRKQSLKEVEYSISEVEAKLEAGRCLRCDLEFTDKKEKYRETGDQSS